MGGRRLEVDMHSGKSSVHPVRKQLNTNEQITMSIDTGVVCWRMKTKILLLNGLRSLYFGCSYEQEVTSCYK